MGNKKEIKDKDLKKVQGGKFYDVKGTNLEPNGSNDFTTNAVPLSSAIDNFNVGKKGPEETNK